MPESQSGPYLHGHHASVLRSHSWRTVENSAPHVIPYLDPNNPSLRILDVGCGPGTISVDFASRIPKGFVYAFDPSPDVISKARKHAEEKGVTNIRFEVGDIFSWRTMDGISEGGFDIVHAHQVLQHLQDPVGAMREMKKLTKKGTGIVAVRDVDYSVMTWYPEIPGLNEWKDLYLKAARGIGCDPNIGRRLHAVAMEAGFERKDVEASGAVWVFSTEEERAWWCGLWAERVVASDFKTRCVEGGLCGMEDLERVSGAWRELEKAEDGWFGVLNGAVVCHVKE